MNVFDVLRSWILTGTEWTVGTITGAYSTDNLQLVSKYGGVIADGASTEKFHPAKFEQVLATQKMRLPYQYEFVSASIGSNQGTNIYGSKDATTTGGHKDTAGRRMISNIGLEDCCGLQYQSGINNCGSYTPSSEKNSNRYNSWDRYVKGNVMELDFQVNFGGTYNSSSQCGSRFAYWGRGSTDADGKSAARAVSEPLIS